MSLMEERIVCLALVNMSTVHWDLYGIRFLEKNDGGGVQFRKDIAIIDDLFFTYEIMNNANRICVVDLPMYHYRYVCGGVSKGKNILKFDRCLKGFETLDAWAEKNAPFCRSGIITNYIFWNTKTCESMLDSVNMEQYIRCQRNIEKNKEYISGCSTRIRILANAIRKSWRTYAIFGWFFWYMKRGYIFIKRVINY